MKLNSVSELAPANQYLKEMLADMAKSISEMGEAAAGSILKTASHMASDFGMPPLVLNPTREERNAAAMVPKLTESRKKMGYDILDKKLGELGSDVKDRYPVTGYVDRYEAASCINGKNSLLDIKYLLDAQNKNVTDILDLVNLFRRFETAGLIKL